MDDSQSNHVLHNVPEDGLYSKVTAGLHEGLVIYELGMASYMLRELLGIEYFIGIATHGTQAQFFDWMVKTTGANLSDWEPVTLGLYECWTTVRSDLLDSENPYSYSVWAHRPEQDAVSSRLVNVFALRHRAWNLIEQEREREFLCAVERSWAVAEWSRNNPGLEATPEVMKGRQARGFSLSGKPKNAVSRMELTWPSSDLGSLLEQAKEFSSAGVTDILICESGIGLRFDEVGADVWQRMVMLDRRRGQNGCLLGLAQELGIA